MYEHLQNDSIFISMLTRKEGTNFFGNTFIHFSFHYNCLNLVSLQFFISRFILFLRCFSIYQKSLISTAYFHDVMEFPRRICSIMWLLGPQLSYIIFNKIKQDLYQQCCGVSVLNYHTYSLQRQTGLAWHMFFQICFA
jgi:hypothetical protein